MANSTINKYSKDVNFCSFKEVEISKKYSAEKKQTKNFDI
jgi:hypothetical protein